MMLGGTGVGSLGSLRARFEQTNPEGFQGCAKTSEEGSF